MGIRKVGLCLAMVAWLGSGTAAAQDASILGAVTDETKAALPGVTVTATSIDTGRVFTDGHRRARRIPPARAAAGPLQGPGRAVRLRDRRRARRRAAGRPEPHRCRSR